MRICIHPQSGWLQDHLVLETDSPFRIILYWTTLGRLSLPCGGILLRGPEASKHARARILNVEASMFKRYFVAAALATLSLVWVLSAQSDLKATVDKSMKAMGLDSVKSLTLTGE